ncbi:PREDICTED: probable membrane-associated kinase regulator 4-like [Fragaria vesca subsp. vesca]
MAINQASSDHQTSDEDYIDMEVSSSSSNFFCYSISSSPPQTREFEFQMSSVPDHDKQSTTSPADELFYKGTLLPLHLPPRLQMVQNILQTSNATKLDNKTQQAIEQSFNLPFIKSSRTAPNTNTSTPLDRSCNISPSESRRVSSELNPDDYVSGWTEEMSVFIGDDPSKKSNWSKKLKLIKQSILSQKLKASRAYVKSLFSKSTCADHECSSAKLASNTEPENGSKGNKEYLNKYMKMAKKNPFGKIDNGRYQISSTTLMKSIEKEMAEENATTIHRNSSGFSDSQLLKRSISANSEIESSIEGAIAHCKQSQQIVGVKRQFVGVKRHQDLPNATSKAMRETHMIAL